MKERPILFNGEMVRAILDGSKTMTRRVVKPQPELPDEVTMISDMKPGFIDNNKKGFICPYGKIGDRLWVRETYALCGGFDETKTSSLNKEWSDHQVENNLIFYSTEGEQNPGTTVGEMISGRGKWRPSIFMPRWASRINLEITNIRVERLQSISGIDAINEGIQSISKFDNADISDYKELWDSINSKRGFGWEKNPLVWVVEFRRVVK